MIITSLNNSKVTYLCKLKMKKYRDSEKMFIVESEHLVQEALKKGIVKEIITTEPIESSLPVTMVSQEVMKKISSLNSPSKIMALCNYIVPSEIKKNILLLDKLQDPGNLGTIIRSAVAFDFDTIIVSLDTVDFYNDKVIRSSEGMIFNVNIIKGKLTDWIKDLKEKGYTIYGTDVLGGTSIEAREKVALVIGNEGSGISSEVKMLCDNFVHIKMNEKCESLNAAVAACILMHEVYNEK